MGKLQVAAAMLNERITESIIKKKNVRPGQLVEYILATWPQYSTMNQSTLHSRVSKVLLDMARHGECVIQDAGTRNKSYHYTGSVREKYVRFYKNPITMF